ncbi:hypothetical protein V3C99_014419 [Haemonchus contortus]
MGALTSREDDEPRTVAEAKAEITELLTRIKDHYEAINRLRLADRTKWKDFNRIVEELELVKARALKEEKKRQRDLERAQERKLLEERGFSGVPSSAPKGSAGRSSTERAHQAGGTEKGSPESKKSSKTDGGHRSSSAADKVVRVDSTQPTAGENDETDSQSKSKNARFERSSSKKGRARGSKQHEDVFVHIDMESSGALHRAKVVKSQKSDKRRSQSSFSDDRHGCSAGQDPAGQQKASELKSDDEYVPSIDLAEDKWRYL